MSFFSSSGDSHQQINNLNRDIDGLRRELREREIKYAAMLVECRRITEKYENLQVTHNQLKESYKTATEPANSPAGTSYKGFKQIKEETPPYCMQVLMFNPSRNRYELGRYEGGKWSSDGGLGDCRDEEFPLWDYLPASPQHALLTSRERDILNSAATSLQAHSGLDKSEAILNIMSGMSQEINLSCVNKMLQESGNEPL